MKNVKMIKKLSLLVAIAALFTACRKEDQKPVLDIKFAMEQTDQFEYAEVAFDQLFLYGLDGKDTFKSNLQRFNNRVMTGFQLNRGGTQNVGERSHFEMKVVALKPDASLYLHLTTGGAVQKVWESLGDGKIYLEHPVVLNANESYEVKFTMNTEEAVVIQNNKPAIDWSKVKAQIIKK